MIVPKAVRNLAKQLFFFRATFFGARAAPCLFVETHFTDRHLADTWRVKRLVDQSTLGHMVES